MIEKFNIRVYALIVNEQEEVLLSDEYFRQSPMTKFPGGGMKHGEGPIDCLRREIREELGREVEVLDHCYTTDFFQRSVFFPTHQLICIYYMARFSDASQLTRPAPENGSGPGHINKDSGHTAGKEHRPGISQEDGPHAFRWKPIRELAPDELTFPADRKAAERLIERYA